MKHAASLILGAVRNPASTIDLSLEDWDLLLRLARRTSLLAYLAVTLKDLNQFDAVPARARGTLQSAINEVQKLQQMGSWEVNRMEWALRGTGIQLVLLKGMAYFKMALPYARARPFSDVDVLVPRERLEDTERVLSEAGWVGMKSDEYDRFYYREWMHELPPLRHEERETIVDLHHSIVPRTSRMNMDPASLFVGAREVDGAGVAVLKPTDMLIHASVHLFHDGDLGDYLRDLLDVDQLTRSFTSTEPEFVPDLIARAEQLGAGRTLFYSLRYSSILLGTPIPDQAFELLRQHQPPWPILRLMDRLVPLAILPEHPDHHSFVTGIARWCLYVRSHYLRMPLKILIPHLLRKSRRRRKTYFELIGAER